MRRPSLVYSTSFIYASISSNPRSWRRWRFSSARGSGTVERINPGPWSSMVISTRSSEIAAYIRTVLAQAKRPAAFLQMVVDLDQLPQGGRGKMIDIGKIQQELGALARLNEFKQSLPDFVDIELVEDFTLAKFHDIDLLVLVLVFFNLK